MVDLRAMRLAAGLTVRELAARAGTSHATIVAYEAGRKVPRSDTRDRLIRAAGYIPAPLGPRRVAVDERGHPRGQELVDVLELADVLAASSATRRPPDRFLDAPMLPRRASP